MLNKSITSLQVNHKLFWRLLMACICLFAGSANVFAADVNEERLQAVMLYNISKFVDWPQSQESKSIVQSLSFCVFGNIRVQQTLENLALRGKTVKGRKIKVQAVNISPPAGSCDVMYISKDSSVNLIAWLRLVQNQHVLTVSNQHDGSELGAMINFIKRGRRVAFEVNPQEAEKAGLKFSSELLRLGLIKSTQKDKVHKESQSIDKSVLLEQEEIPQPESILDGDRL